MTPEQTCVIASSASNEANARNPPRRLRIKPEFIQHQRARLEIESPAQRIFDGSRLLKDLLEHEVFVAALFGLHRTPVDAAASPLHQSPVQGLDVYPRRSKLGQLKIGRA